MPLKGAPKAESGECQRPASICDAYKRDCAKCRNRNEEKKEVEVEDQPELGWYW